ncbi:TonB-dependent receptor domain-containing protein [Methylophaga sp.]|uniref:TonB-dependent receptor domain-containing protein n=1 Tax=Methylophaga sp. TaxID=2024840 RepID=UPI003A940309
MQKNSHNEPVVAQSRPKSEARKIFLSVALAASIGLSTTSYAEEVESVQTYDIPAGPLGAALSKLAVSAGIELSFEPDLTRGLTATPVTGKFTPTQALEQMLVGSSLLIKQREDGSYTLEKVTQPEAGVSLALPMVTVTGEKVERNLQNTLSSVEVVTSSDIRQHADQDIQNIMERTPGVYTQSGNENWGIRGVPVSGFDSQGAGTMNGAVTVFVDGAPQTHRLITLNPLSLWDIDQVEIFRGAQSTTQGRNSLAGAVVLKTKDPSYKPELAAEANIGKYGERGAALVTGGTLLEDTVAGRLALDYHEEDGYIRNEALGIDGNGTRSFNARGKLLIQPTDKLDLLLTLNRTEHQTGAETVSAIDGKPLYYKHFLNTEERDELDQNTAVAKLDYYLSDDWTLTSISTGTWAKYYAVLDYDQGVEREQEAIRKHEQRLLSQELRLAYNSERLSGFFGAYYATHTNDIDDRINLKLSGTDDPALVALGDISIRNMALFGELNWEFVNDWTLITGLRYDHEENNSKFNYTDPLGFATVQAADVDTSFNELLPKLGISHQLNQDHVLGLTWQKGYRGGGVDLSTSTEHLPYDPEYTSTFELAWRGSWLNDRLITNANLYHTDWKDQQVEVGDENDIAFVANAAEARMKGLEFSANYKASQALDLFFSTAYNDTEYREFILDGQDLSGQTFPFAPKFKITVGGSYTFANGIQIGTDIIHQSHSITFDYDDDDNVVERKNDRVTLVNLNAEYKISKNLSLTGYVRNLFDRKYITNNQDDSSLDVGAPRTLGIAFRAQM